ncbi:unnamed protein product [Somion occarium]|uniref:Uncharacterized protein n=1 Tax=Somion occarium TaxID=3059160 RepID=A0ABP1DSS3_9APHY
MDDGSKVDSSESSYVASQAQSRTCPVCEQPIAWRLLGDAIHVCYTQTITQTVHYIRYNPLDSPAAERARIERSCVDRQPSSFVWLRYNSQVDQGIGESRRLLCICCHCFVASFQPAL